MTTRPFPPAQPHGDFDEILPDVFFLTGTIAMSSLMKFSRNMVVLREGERLVIVNSVRLDEVGLAKLDALGTVTDVVRLAAGHGSDDPFYKDRYDAKVWAVKGQTYFTGLDPAKGAVYFEPDAYLETGAEGPVSGATIHHIDAALPDAVMRIEAGGGSVIAGDCLQNWAKPDRYFSLVAKVAMRFMGFIGAAQLGPGWLRAKPDKAQVRGLLDLDFANLLPAHGTPVIGDAKEQFRASIERYAGE